MTDTIHAAPAAIPGVRPTVATDARRWLQLGLAAAWLSAGLLQAQTFMFTAGFGKMLAMSGAGNPAWIASSVHWAAHIVQQQPLGWNVLFASIQLALGLGIAFRPTVRVALAGSIAWALIVWWFGEGLGGLLTGGADALTGAPGSALLYAVLAVLVWPAATGEARRPAFVAERPLGPAAARAVWVVFWAGLAALNLLPANLTANAVHDSVAGMGDGQPGWVAAAVNGFAAASRGNGVPLTIAGTVVLLAIAVGGVLPRRGLRAAVVLAVIASAFMWLVGQALGAVFGGESTDLNSGPLLILIALSYWPLASTEAAHA